MSNSEIDELKRQNAFMRDALNNIAKSDAWSGRMALVQIAKSTLAWV